MHFENDEEAREEFVNLPRWPRGKHVLTFGDQAAPHLFCGKHNIKGAGCPRCHKPLLRMLSVDTAKTPFPWPDGSPRWVHLFYCWTCSLPDGPFVYQLNRNGDVRVLHVEDGPPLLGPEGPYEGYTGRFPLQPVGLRALSPEEEELDLKAGQEIFLRANADWLGRDVHHVGGFPFLFNPPDADTMCCPNCEAIMPLFAAIHDNAAGNGPGSFTRLTETFTGNCGITHVFYYCVKCCIVAAFHDVD